MAQTTATTTPTTVPRVALSPGIVEEVLKNAISKKVVSASQPLVLMFDMDVFESAVKSLHEAFHTTTTDARQHFLHTMAVKANPTLSIMKIAHSHGLGFESASIGELTQSLRVCSTPTRIVFDSPVKTTKELQLALTSGVNLNADNFQELERITQMVIQDQKLYDYYTTRGRIGLRINAQVGSGSITTHSTGLSTSKFGVGLQDVGVKQRIMQYFKDFPFLKMLHVHSGSQGMDLNVLAEGIKYTIELAKAIGTKQVDTIDIGGGLPVNFSSDEILPSFSTYASILRRTTPELFDGTFSCGVITEFGRSLFAKAGWFASYVEYTKNNGGRHIVLQHAGADIAIRTVYHPNVWPLRISIHDPSGNKRTEHVKEQDIAGPCCIAGDIIAHRRNLPEAFPGDFVVIYDIGAYYHSSYSRYNCRQSPPVVGYTVEPGGDEGEVRLKTLQKGESVEESLEMFCRL